jgi:hypothetical protein
MKNGINLGISKRHLAQESAANSEKSPEAIVKTKSYASLKNWGHDFLKNQDTNQKSKANGNNKRDMQNDEKGNDEDPRSDTSDESQSQMTEDEDTTGQPSKTKRKRSETETKANKKREVKEGQRSTRERDIEQQDASEVKGVGGNRDRKESTRKQQNDNSTANTEKDEKKCGNSNSEHTNGQKGSESKASADEEKARQPENGPDVGDTVSWNWGNGQPRGKVVDVQAKK